MAGSESWIDSPNVKWYIKPISHKIWVQWQKIIKFSHCGLHSFLRTYVHLLVNWHCFSEIRSGRQRRWWIAGKTKNKRGHRFNGRCSHYRTDGGHYTYRFAATRLWGIVSQILTFPWKSNIWYPIMYLSIYFRIFFTLGKYNLKQVLLMIAGNPAYGLANLHGPWVKPQLSNTLCRIQGFWIQKVKWRFWTAA